MLDTIFNEDCLEGMKRIPDKSIDMILCDLPYGTTQNSWDSIIPLDKLWEQYNRVIKDNGAIVLFSQMPFTAELVHSNLRNFRYEWIWEKDKGTGFLNAKKMPMKAHENIVVFYKNLPTYNPQMRNGKPYKQHYTEANLCSSNYGNASPVYVEAVYDNRYPISILKYRRDTNNLHPTQKPTSILSYLIKTYTNEGETVLDNCMGSGGTAIACLHTKRHFIGFELEKDYYNTIQERIEKYLKANGKESIEDCYK